MRIISKGTVPKVKMLRGVCVHCACEVTFTEKNAKHWLPGAPHNPKKFFAVNCPTTGCMHSIWAPEDSAETCSASHEGVVEVVKEGTLPAGFLYRGACNVCTSEVEFTSEEAYAVYLGGATRSTHANAVYEYKLAHCPVDECGGIIQGQISTYRHMHTYERI